MFYKLMKVIAKVVIPIFFRIKINGKENMVVEGPLIISSNHISFYDPIFISFISKRDIHFLAKKELFNRFTSWFFKKLHTIPVNRKSGNAIRPVRQALRVLKEGEVIGIFPEGTRVKNGELVEPKKGVAYFSVKSEVSVLPVAITFCKRKHWCRKNIIINIGSAIDVTSMHTNNYKELADMIMQQSRSLLWKQQENEVVLREGSTQQVK